MGNPNQDKTCFIITPIGGERSDIRREANGVIDAVIIPALKEIGFQERNIQVAHRMSSSGSINRQVIKSVLESDLAIANLTTLNPNVMYELAIRHAAAKPVIQICKHDTDLPFDVIDERTMFYTNDMSGVLELSEVFKEMVVEALKGGKLDNPISRVIEDNNFMRNLNEDDPMKFVINRLNSLEDNLTSLLHSSNHNSSQINNPRRSGKYLGIKESAFVAIFKLDKEKISSRQFHESLEQYNSQNPKVRLKASFLRDIAEVQIYTSDMSSYNQSLDYMLNLEGVSFQGNEDVHLVKS
ncbi:TPA: hypothetical protein QCZ17_000927 [Bacillus cereus]|nr:hypothetical protein [Bacillus cereus]